MSRITLPILDAVTLTAACTHIVAEARAAFEALAALPLAEVTPATVLDEWDRIGQLVENVEGPVSILNNVHPDKSVRDAADDAIRQLASFQVEIFQNEALYARVRAVTPSTPAEEQFRQDLTESFEDTGVTLPPDRRARAKAIADRITALYQEFSRNLRDNQLRMPFTPDEMRGLPEPFLSRQPRDAEGRYLLSFDYPDFNPFMANAEDEAARQRYYVAYLNRGTTRNVEILDEVMALRHELAGLYGLPSFASFVLRRRMAGNPEAVNRFLAEVRSAVEEGERRDLDELRALKAERLGRQVNGVQVARWDIAFLSERLRERRYSVDQESLRRYFPPQATLDWLLDVSGEVFGLRFVQVRVPTWHEDVVYVDVLDRDDGHFIGGIYFDLYPREGKFPHAAAWPVRGVSTRAGRTPVSVLVTNFDRRGLTHDEVETLFHEFGHILHGVLSETTFNFHAGTSVQRDFVETPSQIYEEWTRRIREPRAHAAGVAGHTGDGRQPRRATQRRTPIRSGAPLRAAMALRVVRSRAHGSRAWRVDGCVAAHGGGHRARPCQRHGLSRHFRSHRRRLRGRLLRVHVGRGHRARHAVGLRRDADQPARRAALPPGDPEPGGGGAGVDAGRAVSRPAGERRGVFQGDRRRPGVTFVIRGR